jgi:hypothetical protein
VTVRRSGSTSTPLVFGYGARVICRAFLSFLRSKSSVLRKKSKPLLAYF